MGLQDRRIRSRLSFRHLRSWRCPRAAQPAAIAHEFIRHYEDAARIVKYLQANQIDDLNARALMDEMAAMKQIAGPIDAEDEAFAVRDDAKWAELHKAFAAIAPMFWGPRISLEQACVLIGEWFSRLR